MHQHQDVGGGYRLQPPALNERERAEVARIFWELSLPRVSKWRRWFFLLLGMSIGFVLGTVTALASLPNRSIPTEPIESRSTVVPSEALPPRLCPMIDLWPRCPMSPLLSQPFCVRPVSLFFDARY